MADSLPINEQFKNNIQMLATKDAARAYSTLTSFWNYDLQSDDARTEFLPVAVQAIDPVFTSALEQRNYKTAFESKGFEYNILKKYKKDEVACAQSIDDMDKAFTIALEEKDFKYAFSIHGRQYRATSEDGEKKKQLVSNLGQVFQVALAENDFQYAIRVNLSHYRKTEGEEAKQVISSLDQVFKAAMQAKAFEHAYKAKSEQYYKVRSESLEAKQIVDDLRTLRPELTEADYFGAEVDRFDLEAIIKNHDRFHPETAVKNFVKPEMV